MKPRCTTECAQDFRRLESEKSALAVAAAQRGDFRWLIEAPGQRYLSVRHLTGAGMYDFVWTTDHNAALFFKNEEQANLTMMAVRQLSRESGGAFGNLFLFEASLGNAKPVEHGWMARS